MNTRIQFAPARGLHLGGFTLLELLVTVAVMGMLLTFGVPSFQQVVSDSRRTSDVNELLLSMNLARSEALKRNRHVTLCKSSNGTSCAAVTTPWIKGWIVFVNNGSANLGTVDAGEEILLAKSPLSKNSVLTADAAVSEFTSFRPDGRVNIPGGLTWCDERGADHARGIFVSPTGRPAVTHERPDGSTLVCP